MALLVSVTFLALHLFVKPLKRALDGALMALIELALILIYTCVLLIKTCEESATVCELYGFGRNPKGVYLFFIFFGLSMLLVLLIVACTNLYVTGNLPKVLLVAQAHSVPLSTIVQRVSARKMRYLKDRVSRMLKIDVLRLAPQTASAVYRFRTTAAIYRTTPPADAPEVILPLMTGSLADLHIGDKFLRTTCFVQVDFNENLFIRWAHTLFISTHQMEDVQLIAKQSSRRRNSLYLVMNVMKQAPPTRKAAQSSPRAACSALAQVTRSNTAAASEVHVRYNDCGGISRVLELRMPASKASAWAEGLRALREIIPRVASPAHWRWSCACMAATSDRGATGFLRLAELRSLLRCANASTSLSSAALQDALRTVQEHEHLELPQWSLAARTGDDRRQKMLNARHATGMLLRLSVLSLETTRLFDKYADGGQMTLANFSHFIEVEQLASREDGHVNGVCPEELAEAQRLFESTCSTLKNESVLNSVQFALQVLAPHNTALLTAAAEHELEQPLAHYWCATSHNSCTSPGLEPCGCRIHTL